MKKVRVFLILVWSILIVSCSPKITEGVIQTAIAQTQQSLPTLTPKPSDTKTQTRTLTNSPTITYTPTIEATSTVTLTPSITVTPTITPTLTKPPSPTATADMRLKLSLSEFV
ncbi:MAG: hypothetical protein U1B80_10770, partial [Anaerolineaceae bacterium]|nr:hypothetical protein [Anaerolineaceae bacterium]